MARRWGERLAGLLEFGAGVPVLPSGAPVAAAAPARRGVNVSRGFSSPTVPWGLGPPLAPVDVADGWGLVDRDAAMSLPTIQRGRDLIVSAVSACPFTLWRTDRTVIPPTDERIGDAGWFDTPDPDQTCQWLLAWTVDDLLFYSDAYWRVTARYADTGYPRAFRRIAPGCLDVRDGFVMVTDPLYNDGRPERVELADVIEFCSPLEGLLNNGGRAIGIALSLDAAAARFADNEVPAGYLRQREGSEDLTTAEMADETAAWTIARRTGTVAYLNQWTEYVEASYDPSRMQVVEGRTYQALELSRLANIPPYLTGAPAGTGMTYLNAEQAKADLIDFGAAPLITCLEQTLSGPRVTPRGQHVRLDLNVWLRNPFNPPTPLSQPEVPAPPVTEVPS